MNNGASMSLYWKNMALEKSKQRKEKTIPSTAQNKLTVSMRAPAGKELDLMRQDKTRSQENLFSGPSQSLFQKWMEAKVPTVQIGQITALASAVLDDREKAERWLTQPNIATDNRPPLELIGEQGGYERVKDLLFRIEYGALA